MFHLLTKLCNGSFIDIFVNDLSLPLWAAIPSRVAARIASEVAEDLDQRLEDCSPDLLEQIYTVIPREDNVHP